MDNSREDNEKQEGVEVIGMGLAGVAVLLVIIGFLLVIQWHRNVYNKTVENLPIPTNGKMSPGISRIQNRPLPVPNTQETASRGPYRSEYPNHKRKSRSLHNLLDSAQNKLFPLRSDLSLQILYSPTHIIGRGIRNGSQDYNLTKGICSCDDIQHGDMNMDKDGIKLEFLYAKVRKDKTTNTDEHSANAKSGSLNNIRHECFQEDAHEDLYNTIDEDDSFVYDDVNKSCMNETSNEEEMNTRHGESNYDYSAAPIL